jgi:AcrR family transcriptional regulator
MEDVAAEAQLGKGTLYLYFRTKVDLLMGVAMRHQRRQLERFEAESKAADNGLDEVHRLLLAYAEHMTSPPEHLKMVVGRWAHGAPLADDLTTAGAMRENIMRIFGVMQAAVERGQADGSIRPEPDPAPLCMKLWAGINGALLVQLQLRCFGEHTPLADIAPTPQDMAELLLSAIRSDGSRAPSSYDTLTAEEAGS